jgi:hypothetical protein
MRNHWVDYDSRLASVRRILGSNDFKASLFIVMD